MTARIEYHSVDSGQQGRLAVLALPALLEFEELRQNDDYREDLLRITDSLAEFDRTEVVIFDDDRVVGGSTIVLTDDPHVGPHLTLQWHYVLPAYRKLSLGRYSVRELLRQAGWAGIKYVSYTHRVGTGRYMTTYREVQRGKINPAT